MMRCFVENARRRYAIIGTLSAAAAGVPGAAAFLRIPVVAKNNIEFEYFTAYVSCKSRVEIYAAE